MKKIILALAILSFGVASTSHASILSKIIDDAGDNMKGTVRFVVDPLGIKRKVINEVSRVVNPATVAVVAGAARARKISVDTKGVISINGGEVQAISATVPSIVTISVFNTFWNLTVSSATKITRANNQVTNLGEVLVGDIVNITGKLIAESESPYAIATASLKDFSIQESLVTFSGAVTNASASSFMFRPKDRKVQTVTPSAGAVVTIDGVASPLDGIAGPFGAILNGMTVTAVGLWNNEASTFLATKITAKSKLSSISGVLGIAAADTIRIGNDAIMIVENGKTIFVVTSQDTKVTVNGAKSSAELLRAGMSAKISGFFLNNEGTRIRASSISARTN